MNYQDKIQKLIGVIEDVEIILIGAGAGLSTSAGLEYSGARFENNFQDFISKYKLSDMYSSGFYPFKTQEEKWAYWSRHIKLNRYDKLENNVYPNLRKLILEKQYFIITTNADHLFYRESFEKERIFSVQGDYGKFQCSLPCHDKLYDNYDNIITMVAEQHDCLIPSELVPKCPICGNNMEINIRKDNSFIQDINWNAECDRYNKFVNYIGEKNVVLLELGVGYNTPGIIKYPFESFVENHTNATLVRINMDDAEVNSSVQDNTIEFSHDISKVVSRIVK